jgi:hypothetical protein
VCRLHIASGVDAWSASGRTKLIENVLPDAFPGINAVTDEELLKLLVGNEPANEIVDHRSERVVTAHAFVQRFLLGSRRHGCGDRQEHGKQKCYE